MKTGDKILFGGTMSLALAFGFLHVFIPSFPYDFDRLHVFFFNLCAGASILLTYTSGTPRVPRSVYVYFTLAMIYGVSAFLHLYPLTLALSIPLFALVESIRIKRFGLFPWDFFRKKPTNEKFLQAAMLCLSIGIVFASLVILNNEYLHIVTREKLTLDVFFLGYSFPLSLLTFSVMYSFMDQDGTRSYRIMKEVSFWSINLGVIFFFVFIIFELAIPEIIISTALLLAVFMTYYIFLKRSLAVQQKSILSSGMMFLVVTGLTGIIYLFYYFYPSLREYHEVLMVLHATVALYGWNLSGLFIVVRQNDFPIFKQTKWIIVLHWLTVMILAPLGKYYGVFSLIALPAYMLLLGVIFFTKSPSKRHEVEAR
jgi:hypothetical protein